MKYLFLMILILSGCSNHKFNPGDCIKLDVFKEKWEDQSDNIFLKILEVGKENYRYVSCPRTKCITSYSTDFISITDNIFIKVDNKYCEVTNDTH